MLIAREKKKTNIAEYIIYMWQIEDIIRACNFNIDIIEDKIISQMKAENHQYEEIRIWYTDLIEKMKSEKIEKKGHLNFVRDIINELNIFHLELLNSDSEKKYKEIYTWAQINIDNLRKKSDKSLNDIEVCLIGLYGLLIMRLKKQAVSEETKQALHTFSNLLALLSKKYLIKGN